MIIHEHQSMLSKWTPRLFHLLGQIVAHSPALTYNCAYIPIDSLAEEQGRNVRIVLVYIALANRSRCRNRLYVRNEYERKQDHGAQGEESRPHRSIL